MQQFTPYFPGFDGQQQQNQNQNQQQSQNNQVQQPQPQQPMSLNGANLAIYSPAAMPPLSVLAATQVKMEEQQQQQQGLDIGAHGKPKRKQVKNACVNCQKACKKCDVGRPCQRCIKYGLTETCVNSVRKERKKGVKRGPYKKRNKNVTDSVTSSGASTPMSAPVVNANLYTPPTQTNGASVPATSSTTTTPTTSNTMPIHYQPFQTAQAYDPYGYNGSSAMMPQAYMVPNNLAQMYPTNPPVLSYQAAMNIISPQQQHQSPVLNNGFRQDQQSPDPNANNSAAATPTNSAPTATDGSIAKVEEDDDDEGSKLTILSQLCSSVLANNDGTKPADTLEEIKSEETHQNTPPPSRPHSREASHENNNITGTSFTADSAHTYVNSHLSHVTNSNTSAPNSVYGTPGSSPAGSPLQQQAQQQQQQPQAQQQ
ncbi:hypothetical protein MAM1_0004d00530 [Mucor ambiguus]|uniref:Zn(2)-C6 fungal-type domain-containing protein n=1 Tax=Mucor ambiguus TaxID=91626 RepID=A0A0C9M4A8_9FUNG|nr:hypothetical protein MAM1_0004d00530 [Mucor ambiguus]